MIDLSAAQSMVMKPRATTSNEIFRGTDDIWLDQWVWAGRSFIDIWTPNEHSWL